MSNKQAIQKKEGVRTIKRSISLVFLLSAVSMLAAPIVSAQTSYAWSLSCNGDSSGYASWSWLQDGQVIANATSTSPYCGGTSSLSGTGAVPPNANGVTATLYVSASVSSPFPKSRTGSCVATHSASATKSLSSTRGVSINLKASASCTAKSVFGTQKASENAQFSLTS